MCLAIAQFLAVFVAPALSSGSDLAGPLRAPPAARGPLLKLDRGRLDFGERGHEEAASGELVIRNEGDAPLVISRIKESCSCIKLEPTTVPPIPPGGSRSIHVTMSSGRAIGRLEKRITIESNDPRRRRVDVPVGMRVLDGFRLSARDLRFTGVAGGDPRTLHVDVTRPGRAGTFTLRIEGVRVRFGRSRPEHFTATASKLPGGGYRISVTLSPSHPEGRIQAELRSRIDGRALVIPIAGEMFAWIVVEPTFVGFQGVKPDDPATRTGTIRLSSADGTAFQILDIAAEPSARSKGAVELDFELESEPTMLSHTITIRAERPRDPSKLQSFFGKIVIVTDHPEKPEIAVTYSGFHARPRRR